MAREVKGLKLTTGEELVSTILNVEYEPEKTHDGFVVKGSGKPSKYFLKDPMVLRIQPMAGGKVGLVFVPWTLSNPDLAEVPMGAEFVMAAFPPSLEVERQYLQQTSGIELIAP